MESTESRPLSTGNILRQAKESTVGKYTLIKTIGKGKFAKVKLARHEPTSKDVAIKIIKKTKLAPGSLQELYREARIMKMLHHPNIVQLFQVIETEEKFYLVMEYASRGEMCAYLARHGGMKEDDARAKFRQIVSAVQYCHQKGIVHRDLKTENILLDGEMNVKITDFGLSDEFTPGKKFEKFCGTLPYAAPEIFLGVKYNGPEVDVWSLGVVLYKLVSNAFPFASTTFRNLKRKVVHGKYRIPSCMDPDCVSLLKKLLVVDPTKRAGLDTITKDKWMNQGYDNDEVEPYVEPSQDLTDPKRIASLVCLGFDENDVKNSLNSQKYDDAFATYLLMGKNITDSKTDEIGVESRLSIRDISDRQQVVSYCAAQSPSISKLDKAVSSNGKTKRECLTVASQSQVSVIRSDDIQPQFRRKHYVSDASSEEDGSKKQRHS